MAVDKFSDFAPGLTAPISSGFAVTPSDAADLPFVTRALHIGGGGDVTVTLAGGGSPITLKGYAAGSEPPLRVLRVWATGTTATDIVGLY